MKSHHDRWIAAVAAVLLSAAPSLGATLTAKAGFGGDGWRAPFEALAGDAAGTATSGLYRFMGNAVANTAVNPGNLERGVAFNATTGNLLLVSRGTGTDRIRILDGVTGVDKGALDVTGITGGAFNMNMIGVADDGAIYMANLSTNLDTSPYKIYRWENEASVPTVAYIGGGAGNPAPPLAGARLGDSFDVIGSGADTRLVAGFGATASIPASSGFALFDTNDGVNFAASSVAISSGAPFTTPPVGEFRLGISFIDGDTVMGKSGLNPTTVVDVAGTTGTVVAQHSTDGVALKPMDFAVVGGVPVMAIVEASTGTSDPSRARLFVYDMTDPSLPLADRKIAEASALPSAQVSNPNGVGQVKFGAINGNVATIYAMSTNNGIQAFQLEVVPEPMGIVMSSMAMFVMAATVRGRRRCER